MNRLTTDLAALPQPAPPPDLAAVVLARIARIEEGRPAAVPATHHAWPACATALGGLVAAVAIVMAIPPGSDAAMDVGSPETVALAAGLMLYVAGLFAPVREVP